MKKYFSLFIDTTLCSKCIDACLSVILKKGMSEEGPSIQGTSDRYRCVTEAFVQLTVLHNLSRFAAAPSDDDNQRALLCFVNISDDNAFADNACLVGIRGRIA